MSNCSNPGLLRTIIIILAGIKVVHRPLQVIPSHPPTTQIYPTDIIFPLTLQDTCGAYGKNASLRLLCEPLEPKLLPWANLTMHGSDKEWLLLGHFMAGQEEESITTNESSFISALFMDLFWLLVPLLANTKRGRAASYAVARSWQELGQLMRQALTLMQTAVLHPFLVFMATLLHWCMRPALGIITRLYNRSFYPHDLVASVRENSVTWKEIYRLYMDLHSAQTTSVEASAKQADDRRTTLRDLSVAQERALGTLIRLGQKEAYLESRWQKRESGTQKNSRPDLDDLLADVAQG